MKWTSFSYSLICTYVILESVVANMKPRKQDICFGSLFAITSLFPVNQPILMNAKKNLNFSQNHSMRVYYLSLCVNESIDVGRSYYNANTIISNCIFIRISQYSGYGGVIMIANPSWSNDVAFSVFYNCTCSGYGGAIYISSSNTSVLNMVCANHCNSAQSVHFAWIKTINTNSIQYLSISYCSHNTIGYHPFYLEEGYQNLSYTNSSLNGATMQSGMGLASSFGFISIYCTITNNNVSNSQCLYLNSINGVFSSINLISNNSPSRHGVIYVSVGSVIFSHCIFFENQDTLFCLSVGVLEIKNSFISHSNNISTSNIVSIGLNNTLTKHNTYQISHYSTHNCVSNSQVIEQTPLFTPYRSYDSQCSIHVVPKKEIAIIFSFINSLYYGMFISNE